MRHAISTDRSTAKYKSLQLWYVLYLRYVKKLLRIIIEILQRISNGVSEIFLMLKIVHFYLRVQCKKVILQKQRSKLTKLNFLERKNEN